MNLYEIYVTVPMLTPGLGLLRPKIELVIAETPEAADKKKRDEYWAIEGTEFSEPKLIKLKP